MNNNLFKRISKIISANVNSILDSVENQSPEAIMKEATREINLLTEEIRSELREVCSTKYLASKQILQKNNKYEEISDQIRIALKEGRDDLAEAAVGIQLDIEDQMPVLEKALHDSTEEEKVLEGYLYALSSKVKEMEREISILSEVKKEKESLTNDHSELETDISKLEKKFDNAFQVAEKLKTSHSRASVADESKLQELERLIRKNKIEERIERYKSKGS